MKKNTFLLSVSLVAVLFVALAAGLLVRVWLPAAILPPLNIPNIVLLSVLALLLEHFIAKGNPRCYWAVALFGAVSFAVLPLMAGFACVHDFWKYGLVGGITFTVTTFLFTSATQRLQTGSKAPAAVILTALGIYLAAQCFAGILL
jgi:hypothetical protein